MPVHRLRAPPCTLGWLRQSVATRQVCLRCRRVQRFPAALGCAPARLHHQRARTDLLTALSTGVPGSGPSWFSTSVQRWIRLVLDDGSVSLGLSSAIDVEAFPAATTTIEQTSRLLHAVREQVLKKRERTDSNMASVRCSSPRSTVDSTGKRVRPHNPITAFATDPAEVKKSDSERSKLTAYAARTRRKLTNS